MSTPDPAARPPLPRSAAPAALWSHLLSRSTTIVNPTLGHPTSAPLAPLDKSGTSMRLLLHDTQAHIERFSARVDQLMQGVEGARDEVRAVSKTCEATWEKGEQACVDLVNRCQTQIQKSIGDPAQTPAVSTLHISLSAIDRSVNAIDKQLGVLHLLNQTQSQTLQSIQEQQTQLLTALLPLPPLLQAVPLHIDAASASLRTAMDETVRAAFSETMRTVVNETVCNAVSETMHAVLKENISAISDAVRGVVSDTVRAAVDDTVSAVIKDSMREVVDDTTRAVFAEISQVVRAPYPGSGSGGSLDSTAIASPPPRSKRKSDEGGFSAHKKSRQARDRGKQNAGQPRLLASQGSPRPLSQSRSPSSLQSQARSISNPAPSNAVLASPSTRTSAYSDSNANPSITHLHITDITIPSLALEQTSRHAHSGKPLTPGSSPTDLLPARHPASPARHPATPAISRPPAPPRTPRSPSTLTPLNPPANSLFPLPGGVPQNREHQPAFSTDRSPSLEFGDANGPSNGFFSPQLVRPMKLMSAREARALGSNREEGKRFIPLNDDDDDDDDEDEEEDGEYQC